MIDEMGRMRRVDDGGRRRSHLFLGVCKRYGILDRGGEGEGVTKMNREMVGDSESNKEVVR